jgi:tRNA(Ile)-lysidine synthase
MMAGEIFTQFQKSVARFRMIVPGDRVLVAYSGGADSSALLHLLIELRSEIPFDLVLAHFNHRLRPAADEDERCVRATARRSGLTLIVKKRYVKAYARSHKLNLEEAARILRYDFLEKAAARAGATKIATGHNLNDQAETFLIRLLRGSGPRGLSGIFPVVGPKIIRPLLEIPRKDIESYCRRKRLVFQTDESNADKRFLRNKIRLELIPYLERNYEPRVVPRLGRLAGILQEEEAVFDEMTRREYARLIHRNGRRVSLDARRLAHLPKGLSRRAVRAFIEEMKGDLRRISFEDIESVLRLAEGRELTLPGKLRLRRENEFISRTAGTAAKNAYALSWNGRHPLRIPGAGMAFAGERMKKTSGARIAFDDEKSCHCDAEKLRFPLLVRSRKEGDRYRPLGAPGRKKLKEILRAKRIPLAERNRLPVFCSRGKIVWAPGLPVAEDFKVTTLTRKIFRLKKIEE